MLRYTVIFCRLNARRRRRRRLRFRKWRGGAGRMERNLAVRTRRTSDYRASDRSIDILTRGGGTEGKGRCAGSRRAAACAN